MDVCLNEISNLKLKTKLGKRCACVCVCDGGGEILKFEKLNLHWHTENLEREKKTDDLMCILTPNK